MKTLNYYISLASNGNAEAAYQAAKLMHHEQYNEVIVQSMLRKAASLGSISAQRWLGLIGLSGKLLDPSSSVSNKKYVADLGIAYSWFKKAAAQGDTISAFAVFKCLQYGIGTSRDTAKANALLETISDNLSYDIMPLVFFFDAYKDGHQSKNPSLKPVESNKLLKELLAS